MTGRRVPYLVLRGRVFQIRLPVPRHLQAAMAKKELHRSIQTCDYKQARRMALRAGSRFADLCATVEQMTDLTAIDVAALIDRFFSELLESYSPAEPVAPADYGWDMNHQEYLAEDMQSELSGMLAHRNYSTAIKNEAARILAAEGVSAADLSATDLGRLHEGIARAKREHINYVLFRQRTLLDPYSPADPLFGGQAVKLAAMPINSGGAAMLGLQQIGTGGALIDRIEQYLASTDCKPYTIKEKKGVLHWFAGKLGPQTDVRAITSDQMIETKIAISAFKVQKQAGKHTKGDKTKDAGTAIHPKTAKKKFDTIKTFMNWLAATGAIGAAPGAQLQIKVPKTPKSQRRRPFSSEELGTLFSSPMYTGCRSASTRYKPGKLIIKDDHYWMPLVLLYTGMRLAEPLQVLAEDVHVDTDYPFFDIDLAKMNLKQDVSDRYVPIHPDLVAFGFADFVRKRKKDKGKVRLFRQINSETHVANYYSKVLGRYLDRVGLDDPRLVAHSFRHGFKDALRNAAVPEGEQKFIMGHSDTEAAHNYGTGSKIEVLWRWVAKLDMQLPANAHDFLRA